MTQQHVLAQQNAPRVVGEGNTIEVRGTRDGVSFAASWKQALLLEGRMFHIDVGDLPADAVFTAVTGGGAGTRLDLEQPEFGVSVPNQTALIPLDIRIGVRADVVADADNMEILLIADTSAAFAADGTSVAETPTNMITDGGVATVATAFSAATGDITDPVVSMILAYKTSQSSLLTAGLAVATLELAYMPEVPPIIKGPGAFYGYWGAVATLGALGAAAVIWAEVPEARYTV
ncbi:hypothetical protein LCGC14_1114980 [marine sediment metagenome]|uniref:Uncharacterized protein n=1 Tax=marine sediment metagenome TaxID=412755 RepID=A0A0F9QBI4_9ZZZZ